MSVSVCVHSRNGVVLGSERSLVHLKKSNRDPRLSSVSFWTVKRKK